uniref:U3 small nucleolar RNA-associated protein 14 homolog A-like n=1 Tax=Myxine glutinosa TaxID=7769 RepID=UPI00358E3FD9
MAVSCTLTSTVIANAFFKHVLFSDSVIGLDEKLEIADLLPSGNSGGRVLQHLQKRLEKLVHAENTLPAPTPQHEVEKARRAATYTKAKQAVDKWVPAVLEGRRDVSLVLPRGNWNMTNDLARPLHDVTRGSKAKTPLEQEVWTLLHGTSTPAPHSKAARILSNAMCIEEARARRAELQKYRALQSYFEAKARRQHKIKSKIYHRIQKRGRVKEENKQLEKLINSNDPSAVDKHFQLLDVARIKERMTLRHKNTGKWAKAQALIAKHDPKARAELHEQLMRSKELNRKQLTTTLFDDGCSDDEIQSIDEETKPCDFGSSTNPWMHTSVQLESCATLVGKDKKKEASEVAEDMKDNEELLKIDSDDDIIEDEQTVCKLQVNPAPRLAQEGQKVFSKEPINDFNEGNEYCEVLFSSCDVNVEAFETISKNDGIKPTMKLSKQIGKQNRTINNEVQSEMGKRKRMRCKNKMKTVTKNSVNVSAKSDEYVLEKCEENVVPSDLMEITTETHSTNCKKKQKAKAGVVKLEHNKKRSDLLIPSSVVFDDVDGEELDDEVDLAFQKLETVTNKKGNTEIKTAKRTKKTKEKSRRQINNKRASVEDMERTMKEDYALSDNLDGEQHSGVTHADHIDPGQFNVCSIFDYPTKEHCTSKVDHVVEKMKAGNARRKQVLTEILDKDKTEQGEGALVVEDEWEGDKSQRALIVEAFSGDDVVGDFSKEKNAKVASEAPQVKDLTLPGWGEWSGGGIAPNPRKRRCFTIRASPVVPRKDRSLPHVILSEKRNAALAQHQVAEIPYPFNTAADFEQSLRGPLGTTWIPSQAARLLTQPRVHTQMGAIIKPMSAEEIFGDAGRHGD